MHTLHKEIKKLKIDNEDLEKKNIKLSERCQKELDMRVEFEDENEDLRGRVAAIDKLQYDLKMEYDIVIDKLTKSKNENIGYLEKISSQEQQMIEIKDKMIEI